jgi:hypothetical protein
MPLKLKNYGRNQKKRKEYIQQSGLLLAGVDVSKAKHDACTTQCHFLKSEDVTGCLFADGSQACSRYKLIN